MPVRRDPRRWAVAAVGLGGVVVGHVLAYALAFPSPLARARHLATTGHGGFGGLATLAATVAFVALAAIGAGALRRREPVAFGHASRTLIAVQVSAFVLLELIERHLHVGATFADPAVAIGILAQVAVALALALLLRGVSRVAIAVARRLDRPCGTAVGAVWSPPASTHLLTTSDRFAPARRRGPPSPSLIV
jgi:hypothetical protein